MPLPVAVAGFFAGLGGLLKLGDNPIIAYFLVLGILFVDSSISYFLNFQGAIGFSVGWIMSGLSGLEIGVSSFELMILVAFTGIILMAVKLRK